MPTQFLQVVRGMLIMTVLLSIAGCSQSPTPVEALDQAKNRIAADQLEEAEILLAGIDASSPEWPESRLLLARVHELKGDMPAARDFLRSIPRTGTRVSSMATLKLAELSLKDCRLSEAAAAYEQLLENSPEDSELRSLLASMLVIGGHRQQADDLLMHLVRRGQISLKDMVMLSQPERQPPETKHLLQCPVDADTDPWALYAHAVIDHVRQDPDSAIQKLRIALERHPEFEEAQAMLGELLLDRGLDEQRLWWSQLTESMRRTAGVWYVRGMLARRNGQTSEAARCFWESIRLNPLHRKSMFQLGQALASIQPDAARDFATRADHQEQYSRLTERVLNAEGRDVAGFTTMIELLVDMGRLWEARTWLRLDNNRHRNMVLSAETVAALEGLVDPDLPRFHPDADLTQKYDLSKLPVPAEPDADRRLTEESDRPETPLKFRDAAKDLGLSFTYDKSSGPTARSIRVFESTGGGVGVIDYDQDGDTDLLFTQGERWKSGDDRPTGGAEWNDMLFRLQAGKVTDVSGVAGISPEDGYGQGCSAADWNQDGFDDLYIANIGMNRLMQNNGDGTFSDITESSGLSSTAWTTSCLVLDLNADGAPDLYDVNYLQGDNVFRIECGENRCSVRNFEGAPDVVSLSTGDGRWVHVDNATPSVTPKGLGVVAIRMPDQALPWLFIANDQVPNFLLRPIGEGRYRDEAAIWGLAVNYLGQPTACMGVACGDVNTDGRLDLFVTNFEGEANCLYLQREGGFFEDSIQGSGLMQPGIPMVGWGTQFLDADNDRDLDLVVTNGHVSDFREPGIEYRMPTHLFRQDASGQFQFEEPSAAGELFGRKQLGRSLAILDWNQDGRQDFVVSCLDTPAMLASNETEMAQNAWLRVKLCGVESSRDASGALVTVTCEGQNLVRSVSSGDGYQCSNDRTLHFGLGRVNAIQSVQIQWPSGRQMSLVNPPMNSTIAVVEGRDGFLTVEQSESGRSDQPIK